MISKLIVGADVFVLIFFTCTKLTCLFVLILLMVILSANGSIFNFVSEFCSLLLNFVSWLIADRALICIKQNDLKFFFSDQFRFYFLNHQLLLILTFVNYYRHYCRPYLIAVPFVLHSLWFQSGLIFHKWLLPNWPPKLLRWAHYKIKDIPKTLSSQLITWKQKLTTKSKNWNPHKIHIGHLWHVSKSTLSWLQICYCENLANNCMTLLAANRHAYKIRAHKPFVQYRISITVNNRCAYDIWHLQFVRQTEHNGICFLAVERLSLSWILRTLTLTTLW